MTSSSKKKVDKMPTKTDLKSKMQTKKIQRKASTGGKKVTHSPADKPSLITLPLEILHGVCSFLPGPADALILSSTCKSLRTALSAKNRALWFGYFNHRQEQEAIVRKYTDAGYKERDLRYLVSIVPPHLNTALHKFIKDMTAVQQHVQQGYRYYYFNGKGDPIFTFYQTFGTHVVQDLQDLQNTAVMLGLAVSKIPRVEYPSFFKIDGGQYHPDVDYRDEALHILSGKKGSGNRCHVCMAPGGLLPELWNTKFEFRGYMLNHGLDDESKRTKIFCKLCVQKEVIHYQVPVPQVPHLSTFQSELSRVAGPGGNRYAHHFSNSAPIDRISNGALDITKIVSEESIYKFFFDVNGVARKYHGSVCLASDIMKASVRASKLSVKDLIQQKGDQHERYSKLISAIISAVVEKFTNEAKNPAFEEAVSCYLKDELGKYVNSWDGTDSLGGIGSKSMIRGPSYYTPFPMSGIRKINAANKQMQTKKGKKKNTLLNIFEFVGGPPIANVSGGSVSRKRIEGWMTKSAEVIVNNFFEKPILPLKLCAQTKLNFFLSWIWKISASKFSRQQEGRAGLCIYCTSEDHTFFTAFYYAAHVYLEHGEKLFTEKHLEWKKRDGEQGGIKDGDLKSVVLCEQLENPRYQNKAMIQSPKQYGPQCHWDEASGKLQASDLWQEYYLLS